MNDYETTQDERLWGMLSYLLALFGLALFGFIGLLGPLIVYVVKKNQSRFVAFHSLQALLADVTLLAFFFAARSFFRIAPDLVVFIFPLILGAHFVYNILGAIKAWDSEWFQIPLVGGFALRQAGAERGRGNDETPPPPPEDLS